MKKIIAVVAVAMGLTAFGAAPAFANSYAYSTDANQGSLVQYTASNLVITAYDQAYDGWGASAQVYYNVGGHVGLNDEDGQGSSLSAHVTPGYAFKFKSCLEHQNGTTLSNCSGLKVGS